MAIEAAFCAILFLCIVAGNKAHGFEIRKEAKFPLRFWGEKERSSGLFSSPRSMESASSATTTASSMKFLEGVRNLVDDYDVFLLDMWGVMHDGVRPYDGVLEAVRSLKEAGKRLVILSNSSKRKDNAARVLKKLGFDPTDFDAIITSGEVAHQFLAGEEESLGCQRCDILLDIRRSAEKQKVFAFGSGDGDETYLESCGWSLAPLEDASLIVSRGTFTINNGSAVIKKTENADLYYTVLEQRLKEAAERKLPMLVTNPDKIRPDADRSPMPGQIGDSYQRALVSSNLGMEREDATKLVHRIGKPFKDVYDIALQDVRDLSRVCMVGDALETDVTGGLCAGIDTVWVLKDGIHSQQFHALVEEEHSFSVPEAAALIAEEFSKKESTYANGRLLSPNIIMPHFRW